MVGPCQHLSKQRVRITLIWPIVIDHKGTACKIPSDAGITSLQKVTCCVAGRSVKRASGDSWATPERENLFMKMQFGSDHSHHDLKSPALHSDQRWTEPEVGSKHHQQIRAAPPPLGRCLQGSRHSRNGFHGEQQKSGSRVLLAHVVSPEWPGATAWSRTGAGQAGVMLLLTLSQTSTIFS